MDPAWSGTGGALPGLVPSCVGHVCRPPINLLHYCKILLDYCIWIVVHSSLIIMLLLKLLYLILSLIIFCFIMKNSTPWPGLTVNPSLLWNNCNEKNHFSFCMSTARSLPGNTVCCMIMLSEIVKLFCCSLMKFICIVYISFTDLV
jgi:hypothetical protein